MHSPALALAWQTCRRHRIGLAIVVGLVLALSVVFQTLSGVEKYAYLCTFQFVFALIYVAAVFAYGFESALESGESGFPRRQFTLPVRTAELVLLPMVLGTAVVALVWTVWAYF